MIRVALRAAVVVLAHSSVLVHATGPTLSLSAIDAASRATLADALGVASEHRELSGFHHSTTICASMAVAKLPAERMPTSFPLSPINTPMSSGEFRYVEVFAYRRDYCVARPRGPVRFGVPLEIEMSREQGSPEHRLRHLVYSARAIGRHCFELPSSILEPVKAAMLAEAKELVHPQDAAQELLALRLAEHFDPRIYAGRAELSTVIHVPAERGDMSVLARMLEWARSPGYVQTTTCLWNRHYCLFPKGTNGDAPRPEAFDIDARDERGFSALMAAAYAMQPEAVRYLMDNGADVNVLDEAGGFAALDLVLSRARDDLKETTSDGIDGHFLRMIDLLKGAAPAPTLNGRYYAELADRASWNLGPRLTAFWERVRERVLPLTPRSRQPSACPIDRVAKESLGLAGK